MKLLHGFLGLSVLLAGMLVSAGTAREAQPPDEQPAKLVWREPALVPPAVVGLPPGALRRFGRQRSILKPLAFSRDDSRVALADYHGVVTPPRLNFIRVLEVATGKVLFTVSLKFTVGKLCVAFSPDGTTLAIGGTDNRLRFWDAHTGKALEQELNHTGRVYQVAYTPDGRHLLSASKGLALWDLKTRQIVRNFEVPKGTREGGYSTVALSPDGKWVAARYDLRMYFWDATTGRYLRDVAAPGYLNPNTVFSHDSKYLFDNIPPNGYQIWEAATGRPLRNPQEVEGGSAFSPDGRRRAFWGNGPHTLCVEDAVTGKNQRAVKLLARPAHWCLSTNGQMVACTGLDGSLYLYDIEKGGEARTIFEPVSAVLAAWPGADGRTLYSLSRDQELHEWQLATGKEVRRAKWPLPKHSLFIAGAADKVFAATNPGPSVWELTTNRVLRIPDTALVWRAGRERETPHEVVASLSPRGALLAALGKDDETHGLVTVWETATGKKRGTVQVSPQAQRVAVTEDGQVLCTELPQGFALWNVKTGKFLFNVEPARVEHTSFWYRRFLFAPDNKTLAVVKRSSYQSPGRRPSPPQLTTTLELWDVSRGKILQTHPCSGSNLAWSRDGRKLAYDGGHHVALLDVHTGKTSRPVWAGHLGSITSILFSADDRSLITTSEDGSILIWEVTTFAEK